MITTEIIHEWDINCEIEPPPELKKAIKKSYAEDYKQWLKEEPDITWKEYIQKEIDEDLVYFYETVLQEYIKEQKIPAAFADIVCTNQEIGEYLLTIHQVRPNTKEDLKELVEIYTQINDTLLPEVVVDHIMNNV